MNRNNFFVYRAKDKKYYQIDFDKKDEEDKAINIIEENNLELKKIEKQIINIRLRKILKSNRINIDNYFIEYMTDEIINDYNDFSILYAMNDNDFLRIVNHYITDDSHKNDKILK